MLTARRKIAKTIQPLGWCIDKHHEGLEATEKELELLERWPGTKLSRCPGSITFSGGIFNGKEMLCICSCHGERELPFWQIEYMKTLAVAEKPDAADEDENESSEASDEAAEAPPSASEPSADQPDGHARQTILETGEEPSGTEGSDRPEGEVAEWTSRRTDPMPVPGGYVERVTFPSPSKPDQRVIGWVAYNDKHERLARVWQRQQAKDICGRLLKPEDES